VDEAEEGPRPPAGFTAYVERGDERIDITHCLQDVYDIAVNSMDFGSGFLSTEEVGNLRKLGHAIDAENFDYQHDKCMFCGHEHQNHYTYDTYGGAPQCTGSYKTCSCLAYVRDIEEVGK